MCWKLMMVFGAYSRCSAKAVRNFPLTLEHIAMTQYDKSLEKATTAADATVSAAALVVDRGTKKSVTNQAFARAEDAAKIKLGLEPTEFGCDDAIKERQEKVLSRLEHLTTLVDTTLASEGGGPAPKVGARSLSDISGGCWVRECLVVVGRTASLIALC